MAGHLDAELLPYREGVFEEAWKRDAIVAVAATGIVVRKIAHLLGDKWSDPAVVVVDGSGGYCVPVLGGHHGGNEVAKEMESLGLDVVITTATEAKGKWSVERLASELRGEVENRRATVKTNLAILDGDVPVKKASGPGTLLVDRDLTVIRRRDGGLSVGLGSRKGVTPEEVFEAIEEVLCDNGVSRDDVEVLATGSLKRGEEGLREASNRLGIPLLYLDREELECFAGPSNSEAERLGWPGVSEAAALAASQHEELIVPKRIEGNVTVAVAK